MADALEILLAGAVTQRVQEIEDQLFKKCGRRLSDLLEKFLRHRPTDLLECAIDAFVGRSLSRRVVKGTSDVIGGITMFLSLPAALADKAPASPFVEPVRIAGE